MSCFTSYLRIKLLYTFVSTAYPPNEDPIISDLQTTVDILETKFQQLTSQTLKRLQQTSVNVGTFYAQVTCMKHTLKRLAGKYVKKSYKQLASSVSPLESLWGELNDFWDFFNYELLQHVIRVMFTEAEDPLLSQLAEYEHEIDRFLSSTKLCHFFKVWPFSIDKPQEKEVAQLKRVVVRVDRKWEDCTLLDVKKISDTFAQGFFLPREFLLLAGVCKSSVSLLWYIPPSLASSIEEKVKEKNDFLSYNGFLSITIDDLQIYLSLMTQCSLHLRGMYERHITCCKSKKLVEKLQMPFKLALITKKEISIFSNDEFSFATLRGDIDDIRYKKSPTTISSLGTLPKGSPPRLVLLEGAPGSGKTTFSFDAVLKWTRNEILTDISLLALFPLRDYNLRKATNLLELLASITPDHESLLEELEANKGEGMAFWFDGWDEIASSLDGHSSIYEQLVSGKILPKARMVVTSRSWATDYIKEQLEQQPSQHIEIVSSYHDQIDWLIEIKTQLSTKLLPMIDDFLKYLQETPAIRGHMYTPLATHITLKVYQWSQESGSPLPTTVTQLYTSYTCLCIHNYLDNHSHFHPKMWKTNDFRDLPEPLHSWFFSLCRLAFDGLEDRQRLVFPDVPNHLRLETLGLMQAQAPLYASEESAVVSYHYKHLTLQEFLYALLLSWMCDEERSVIVERCVRDGRYTMTLRFLSGLTKSSILRDHMQRILNSKHRKNSLTIFHWLFEGGDKTSTADILQEREVTVHSHYSWSALDYFVTGHCIARSNCLWDINFWNAHMGDEKMTQFLQGLSSAHGEQGNPHITLINWSCNELTSQCLYHLKDIPASFLHYLKSFNISQNYLDRTAVDNLSKTIPHITQLEEIKLYDNPEIQRGGAVSLLSALCDQKSLKRLHLQNTNIGKEDCEQIAQLLSSSQFLEELNISDNSLSSDSVHFLFNGLHKSGSMNTLCMYGSNHRSNYISLEAIKSFSAFLQDKKCKLETMDLSKCGISDTALELANGLSRNCSVKILYLSYNPIGDKGAAAFGQVLTENKTITILGLARCNITATGGEALASSLMINSTLEELNLSGNSLGGATASIGQVLEHNQTLKRLNIANDSSQSQSDVNTLIDSLKKNQTLKTLMLPVKFRVNTDTRVRWGL